MCIRDRAKELANKTSQEVYALLLGHNLDNQASELLNYGIDKVFVYDYPELKDFLIKPYSNAFEDFINHVKPSSILIGAKMCIRDRLYALLLLLILINRNFYIEIVVL